jgi:DHA1 family inner membrane transport protein
VIATLALSAMLSTTYVVGLSAFLPFIADEFDTSVPVLGQITTIVFLIGAAGGILIGPLADRHGQRRFQMCGAILVIVGALGTAAATGFGTLLIVRLATALSAGMLNAVTLAAAANLFGGDERRKALSWVISGVAGGPIVGVPFLTLVASVSNWRVAHVALALLAAVVLALQWSFLPAGQRGGDSAPFRISSLLAAYRPLVRSRPMLAIFTAHCARVIAWVGIMTYMAAFLSGKHGLSEGEIGWAVMITGLGYFTGSRLAGGRLGFLPLRPLYALTTALMGAAMLAALTLPIGPIGVIGIVTVAALFASASFVCQTTLLANETPAGRSTTMSLNSTFFNIGSAGGGAVGGGLIALSGYTALAVGLAGFSVVSALLVWRPRRQEETEPAIEPVR